MTTVGEPATVPATVTAPATTVLAVKEVSPEMATTEVGAYTRPATAAPPPCA